MQPTTILIENQQQEVAIVSTRSHHTLRYGGSWRTNIPFPYVLIIDDDKKQFDRLYGANYDITATEWLAQHGYVWDGDGYREVKSKCPHCEGKGFIEEGRTDTKECPICITPERELQVGDTVEALMDYSAHDILLLKAGKHYPVLSSEPSYFTIKCEVQKMQWKHSRIHEMFKYVAPEPTPTRTEQREKMLTERGYRLTGRNWVNDHLNYWISDDDVAKISDEEFNKRIMSITTRKQNIHELSDVNNWTNDPEPQPAPYTAGQEVEVYKTIEWVKGKFYAQVEQLYLVTIDGWDRPYPFREAEIRPVQVQPEVPDASICKKCDQLYSTDLLLPDDLWKQIGGDNNVMCPACIIMGLEQINSTPYGAYELRPLITPKQVTDDEIEAEADHQYPSNMIKGMNIGDRMNMAFRVGARWALQKAEGGEG